MIGAAETVRFLAAAGYRITLAGAGDRLHVEPPLATQELREQVLARKADILTYLRELRAPVSQGHAFAAVSAANAESVRARGVCIACGVPWPMHGQPPIEHWLFVDEPNDVALIEATPDGFLSVPVRTVLVVAEAPRG